MGFPYLQRPLNFGHRGAPEMAPENTLASFEQARRMGADGVELDVTLSADGEVVVIHDDTVDRTTDGHGSVKSLTLAQLKALDAGSWFGKAFAGQRLPTLGEAAAWAGTDMLLNIELKSTGIRSDGLEERVVAIVREYGLESRAILSSFALPTIWRVRRMAPDLHTGLLHAVDLPVVLRRVWLRLVTGPHALHPHYQLVTEKYLQWARRKGYRVNVWTPNEASELKRLLAQGVDMIITNRPGLLGQVLDAPK